MNLIRSLIFLLVLALVGIATYIYLGVFEVAADVPHSAFVSNVMELTRQRSIAARAADVKVPPLDDAALIADGAEHYGAMCTGCHLAPGAPDTELRRGLYPKPPNLSQPVNATPAEMFWAIKHGIKMSAMPAWGTSHDDQAIWAMVAFVQKLPGMTPAQYEAMTAAADKAGEPGHHHHGESTVEPAADMAHPEGTHAADEHGTGDQHHEHDGAAAAGATNGGGEAAPERPLSLEGLSPNAVPDAEQVALAFHRALESGDRDAVLALLSADVRVSEAGHTQSRDEYASGHLGEDIAFLKKVEVKPISIASLATGDSALVGSDSEIRSGADGQPKVQRSRELLTLKRENGSWKIVAIRWQSLPAPPANAHDQSNLHR